MAFEEFTIGKIVKLKKSGAYLYSDPKAGKKALTQELKYMFIATGLKIGVSTGNYKLLKKNGVTIRFIQIKTLTAYFTDVMKINFKSKMVYIDASFVTETAPTSLDTLDGEAIVQSTVMIDQATFNNVLSTYNTMLKIKKSGGKIPSIKYWSVMALYKKMVERQNKISETPGVSVVTGYPEKWLGIRSSFAKATAAKVEGIGIIPVVVIIIAVVVGAGAATAVYYALKPSYEDSKADFKLSKSLDSDLKKYLPKETYDKLMKEGEEEVDDAYNAGKTKQKFSDIWAFAKIPIMVVGGYLLVSRAMSFETKRIKKEY